MAETPPVVQQSGVVGVASGAIEALKTSPVLLLIVLLNMVFAVAAAYYLLQVESYRAADRHKVAEMLDKCIGNTVPMEYLLRTHDPKGP
jgi:hypothetical protein